MKEFGIYECIYCICILYMCMHACIEECNHNRVHVHDHVHVLLTAVQIIMT
jgi:hypothetical protein